MGKVGFPCLGRAGESLAATMSPCNSKSDHDLVRQQHPKAHTAVVSNRMAKMWGLISVGRPAVVVHLFWRTVACPPVRGQGDSSGSRPPQCPCEGGSQQSGQQERAVPEICGSGAASSLTFNATGSLVREVRLRGYFHGFCRFFTSHHDLRLSVGCQAAG